MLRKLTTSRVLYIFSSFFVSLNLSRLLDVFVYFQTSMNVKTVLVKTEETVSTSQAAMNANVSADLTENTVKMVRSYTTNPHI